MRRLCRRRAITKKATFIYGVDTNDVTYIDSSLHKPVYCGGSTLSPKDDPYCEVVRGAAKDDNAQCRPILTSY